MELQVPYSILFTFFGFLLFALSTIKSKKSSRNPPPGPTKLPIIGNIHQFVGSQPHHSLRNLARTYGPLMSIKLGEISHVVVSSADMAKEIFKTHDLIFSSRPQLVAASIFTYDAKDIVFCPHGNYWRQLRKICTTELLTVKRVQSFRFIREEEVSALVKKLLESEGSVINLSEKIFSLTTSITSRAAFGKKNKDQEAFLSVLYKIVDLVENFSIADLYPSVKLLQVLSGIHGKIRRVHKELDRILDNIVKDHENKKSEVEAKEDLVDVLLRIQTQNDLEFPFTRDNLKALILDIFAAGTETSSTTVEWVMAELLKHPMVMKKAQAEVRRVYDVKGYVDEANLHQLKYLEAVIKETMRLHPAGALQVPRENTKTVVINGYEIPTKTKIIINNWAIGRDPNYWTEPEEFKPERFLDSPIDFKGNYFQFVPFGGGRRICPGISFATPNIELPIASFLYHFDWKFPNGMTHEEFDMTEAFGTTVRIKNNLCLIPISYRP